MSSRTLSSCTIGNLEPQLIPGLSNDVSMLCLVRLPRRILHIVQGVCRGWRVFLKSEIFANLRKMLGFSQGWIYALSRDNSECLRWHVLDPSLRKWMRLLDMPNACSRRFGIACEVLDRQLYLIGGCGKFVDPTPEVYVFDALQSKWKEVASMEAARCFFVGRALDGKMYAIGGTGTSSNTLTSWEVYDPEKDEWVYHDDPNLVPDLGESLVMDGRIYVRHISPTNGLSFCAAAYDPVRDLWTLLDDEMTRRWHGPAVVVAGETYMLDQTFGVKLLVLDAANKCWHPIGRISHWSIQTPCRLAVVGTTLFVVGRGLKTLMINIDEARKSGYLVTSSVMGLPESPDDVVLSCNAVYI